MAQPRYVRNAEAVKACLKDTASGQWMVTKPCKIQVPSRFIDRNLGEVGIDTYVYGIFALILEDGNYAVNSACAMMKIEPFKILTTEINGVSYHEFFFKAGSVITNSLNLVKDDTSPYYVLDELIFKGNIPWYIEYEDLAKIFDTAAKHAGSKLASNYEILELIASVVSRDPKNRSNYYRSLISTDAEKKTTKPAYVPLASVFFSASNTVDKLAGNYFSDGVVSALVQPANQVEHIESILRR